jgi:hypothetical protein
VNPVIRRWTAECTMLLERLNAEGCTDREIARAIERHTGQRFSIRWVRAQRRLRQIESCWRTWARRRKPAGE